MLYGLDSRTPLVAYAYLWAGIENLTVLNGGLGAWIAVGYDVEYTTVGKLPTDNATVCNILQKRKMGG